MLPATSLQCSSRWEPAAEAKMEAKMDRSFGGGEGALPLILFGEEGLCGHKKVQQAEAR